MPWNLVDASTLVHKAKRQHVDDARQVNSCKQLCDLPDAILLHILALLPTEDVVRTSVLSRRWEYLWTSIPSLVFREEYNYTNRMRMLFGNFVERALSLRDSSSMKAFSLSCVVDSEEYFDCDESLVNKWITAAIRHNVQDLCLHLKFCHHHTLYMLPSCVFECGTLRELHLEMEHDVKLPSLVCLANLKVLTLVDVWFGDDKSAEKLLSCPSLEKLSLTSCRWNLKCLEISAPNLVNLTIVDKDSFGIRNSQVRVHGAFIKSFRYEGKFLYDYIILNSASLVEASIQPHFPCPQGIYHLCKFMKALSNLKQLAFSIRSVERMNAGEDILNSLPVFHSLTELELTDYGVRVESRAMLLLLSKCPILRRLIFSLGGVGVDSESDDGILDPIPSCLTSSLKEIIIHGFRGMGCEILAVRNLVIAAPILDKVFFTWSRRLPKWQGRLSLIELSNKLPGAPDRCTISPGHEQHWDHIWECS